MTRLRSGFARDFATLLSAQVIISAVAIGTAVVMARGLGPEGRGQFTVALLLGSLLVTFTDFGMPIAGPRFIAAGRWAALDILASHLRVALIRIIVLLVAGAGLIATAGEWLFPGVPTDLLLLGLLQIWPLTIASLVLPLLLGLGRGRMYGRLLVVSSVLPFLCLAAIWAAGVLTVHLALSLQLTAGIGVSFLIWRESRKAAGGGGRVTGPYLAEAFRFGFWIYVSNVASFTQSRVTLLILNGILGPAGVGLFTIAQTATDRIFLLADSVATSLLPRVAEDPEGRGRDLTPLAFRGTMVLVTALALLLGMVATPVVTLLFSEAFRGAVPPLRILLVAVVLQSGWRVLSQDLNARGWSRATALVNGCAAITAVTITLALAPRIGLLGAAAAAVGAAGLSFVAGVLLFSQATAGTDRLGIALKRLWIMTPAEQGLIARLGRGVRYGMQLGPSFWWLLARAYVLDGVAYRVAVVVGPVRRRIRIAQEWLGRPEDRRWVRSFAPTLSARLQTARLVGLDDLGLPAADVAVIRSQISRDGTAILGEFDHYGRLVPTRSPIPGMASIAANDARPRSRTMVTLIATPTGIIVRKRYFGPDAEPRFLRSVRTLERLRGSPANVPELLAVDIPRLQADESFIPGTDLMQVLTRLGAELTGAAGRARVGPRATLRDLHKDYIREGARVASTLPPAEREAIWAQLLELHRAGIMIGDIGYGNIVIHRRTGEPYFIDFDGARFNPRFRSRGYLVDRDRDVAALNAMLATDLPTYRGLRTALAQRTFPASAKTYGAAYIGHGLRLGHLWDRSIGFGRWHYILKDALSNPDGCRFLSVGANSASIELHLLREGAEEVVAFEHDPDYIAQGRFLLRACEWADNRAYRLRYIADDMRQVAALPEDRFDTALALCSLYYLPDDAIAEVVTALADRAGRILIQCNVRQDLGRSDPDEYRRASVDFALDMLSKAGCHDLEVKAPAGYSRPLVFGSTRSSGAPQ